MVRTDQFDTGGENMNRATNELFFELIHDYFTIYLPTQKCSSVHTIRSYRMILNQFIDYLCETFDIKMREISFELINLSSVSSYMDWLSVSRHCSDTTCNQHLSGIRSFLSYASNVEPVVVKFFHEVQRISKKKSPKTTSVEYMTEKAVKAMLAQPNQKTNKGIRDLMIMVLMYDTGARISEILNLKVKDIYLTEKPYIKVFGKGSKTRTVPLMSSTVEQLKRYFNIFRYESDEQYLFCTNIHGIDKPLSDNAIRKLLKHYAEMARAVCAEVPENMYPHLWRHTRAMHLYQHGMDLTLISQWLGHSSMETTLIYAHADTEMKRKAIEKANQNTIYAGIRADNSRFTVSDEVTLKKLYGLK